MSNPQTGFPPPAWEEVGPASAAPAQPEPAPGSPGSAKPSADGLLRDIDVARRDVQRPHRGWQSLAYKLTGGRWNPGLSPEEQHAVARRGDITAALNGDLKVVVVFSQKGGMGKTTAVTNLGISLAQNRPDAILGLDVNPDGGSLAIRVPQTSQHTILGLRDKLRAYEQAQRSGVPMPFGTNDLDRYINNAKHRFRTIVMPPGSKPKHPLTGEDFQLIIRALRAMTAYKVILIDCGTDLSAPVMDGVLAEADQLIVAASTVKDEAVVTIGGLEALVAEGQGDLVRDAITIMIEKNPKDPRADAQRAIDRTSAAIRTQFGQVTKEIVSVPYDSRIRAGGLIDPSEVSSATVDAYLEVGSRVIKSLIDAERAEADREDAAAAAERAAEARARDDAGH